MKCCKIRFRVSVSGIKIRKFHLVIVYCSYFRAAQRAKPSLELVSITIFLRSKYQYLNGICRCVLGNEERRDDIILVFYIIR